MTIRRLALIALVGITACGSHAAASPATDTVAAVVDGDTVKMASGATVRLIGIDTPERGECGYDEATSHLSSLVDGQRVTLTPGARDDTDRYGRFLRYVDVGDTDVGLEQIRAALATARYDSTDGYGAHQREDEYRATMEATGLPVCVPGIAPSSTPGVVSGGYPFCEAARVDSAAPLRDGDPGWNPDLDRDGDGVACE